MSPERPRSTRWIVLALYTLVAGASQMLWLNFAPLLTAVEKAYGVGEMAASSLVFVFPLLYVLLSLPTGAWTDRRGYRFTVGLGAALMTIFSCVRIASGSFAALLVGQIGIAVAQPLVLNGISKLVSDWFDEEQGALATGLCTMGIFIGMAIGMGLSPVLHDRLGMRFTMAVFAALTALPSLAFLAFARERPREPSPQAAAGAVGGAVGGNLRALFRNRDLVLVFALNFLGLGFFNGLTTWLEAILAQSGVGAVDAGLVGALMIVGGIVGAVVVPALSDRSRRRKPFVLLCAASALAILYPLCTSRSLPLLLGLGGAMGFGFLPAYALLLEMSAELAGAELAGTATGVLMLAGNAGGVLTILAMPLVKGDAATWGAPVALMLGLLAVAVVLAALVSDAGRSR
jgi:predicted MFS family arabinose efflux permease